MDKLKIIGLIAIGIVIGMILSWIFLFVSVDSVINNVLPKLQIENINMDINETALVEAINNTVGGLRDQEVELHPEKYAQTDNMLFNDKDGFMICKVNSTGRYNCISMLNGKPMPEENFEYNDYSFVELGEQDE